MTIRCKAIVIYLYIPDTKISFRICLWSYVNEKHYYEKYENQFFQKPSFNNGLVPIFLPISCNSFKYVNLNFCIFGGWYLILNFFYLSNCDLHSFWKTAHCNNFYRCLCQYLGLFQNDSWTYFILLNLTIFFIANTTRTMCYHNKI